MVIRLDASDKHLVNALIKKLRKEYSYWTYYNHYNNGESKSLHLHLCTRQYHLSTLSNSPRGNPEEIYDIIKDWDFILGKVESYYNGDYLEQGKYYHSTEHNQLIRVMGFDDLDDRRLAYRPIGLKPGEPDLGTTRKGLAKWVSDEWDDNDVAEILLSELNQRNLEDYPAVKQPMASDTERIYQVKDINFDTVSYEPSMDKITAHWRTDTQYGTIWLYSKGQWVTPITDYWETVERGTTDRTYYVVQNGRQIVTTKADNLTQDQAITIQNALNNER